MNILDLKDEITEAEIKNKVIEIANDISTKYKGETPIIICVLKGAFLFMADIVKALKIDCEIDFIKIGSYGNNIESSGKVSLLQDITSDISGRHVIVIEDIVDTGISIDFLNRHFSELKPKTLKFASLLCKNNLTNLDFNLDWIGFEIKEGFFVGYGLDYKQRFRGLSSIKTIK